MAWPPDLLQLKEHLRIPADDTGDDVNLAGDLAAAVAYVQRVKRRWLDFGEDLLSQLPEPDADVIQGTLRLAGRLFTRRRSPDGMVSAGELGVARVASSDVDIERLLGIGRFSPPLVG